ncbi:hypothetical protein Nepgr_011812 [Nepenthes gracilis]|uniref:LETM1-like protein n=1 Tax=Nepenthes gracilis TaxID=150966 RepID=A0AAD3SGC6_NEPGR|nr:hypothetical protein Nepgr_011812 [Nepenthes gracilis]
MSIKLNQHNFISPSSSSQWVAQRSIKVRYLCKVVDFNHKICFRNWKGRRCFFRCTEFKNSSLSCSCGFVRFGKHHLISHKSKRIGTLLLLASTNDGVTVNGNPQTCASSNVEAMRIKLDQSLQSEDYNDGLVQSLHDAARVFELSIKEQSSLLKISWLTAAWLGVDKTAWAKALSYQASVYSLLQAANEFSSCRDGRDRDISLLVQRSLLRLSAPLESTIREKLSAKQPELCEWFWSEQIPVVVTTFVHHFERDPRFNNATGSGKKMQLGSGNASDVSLLMLALTCTAAIIKLGPAKVSCPQFFTIIPDTTGRLMDMHVDLVPIHEAYHSVKKIGLRREFLLHFGPRAASARVTDDCGTDEIVFWVDLVQKQLQRAIAREKIWSKLTTSESIEVLEKDLAIFGFFIALGRSTQFFLAANGYDKINEPVEGFIRYLIGGIVLYYPQLSSISSYQLYVEVVCDELDWLPFYPGYTNTLKHSHSHKNKFEGPLNAEAIPKAVDVCSHWIWSFIKHSKWLENLSNVKAARFLSKGHNRLRICMEELRVFRDEFANTQATRSTERSKSETNSPFVEDLDSFDMALESVEEALVRLEKLLQELHVCSSGSEKEHLKAACSDLERIRKLKKEAEFLEASFRAKTASLQQGTDDSQPPPSTNEQTKYLKAKYRTSGAGKMDKKNMALGKSRGLWSFLVRPSMKKPEQGSSKALDKTENGSFEQSATAKVGDGKSNSNEFQRFEVLRSELVELEKRVKRSANKSENEDFMEYDDEVRDDGLVIVPKKGNIIEKSFDKLKETSTDVWQGTQLLAIDVAAAMGLLRRVMIGDELTVKEKKALQRTLMDLASVVPIGFLMLLPVTAVGHAAILAAIQRYVPSLIPSTYGPERLDLLRKLEKMKEMETTDAKFDESVEEMG